MNIDYGVRLSFVDEYDAEMSGETETVNFQGKMMKEVFEAVEAYSGLEPLLRSYQEAQIVAPMLNDYLLEANGFNRGDMLPAYIENQLYDEDDPLTDEQINQILDDIKDDLYDAIWHVHSSLKPGYLEDMGEDYMLYANRRAFDSATEKGFPELAEKRRAEAEAAERQHEAENQHKDSAKQSKDIPMPKSYNDYSSVFNPSVEPVTTSNDDELVDDIDKGLNT